MDSWSRQSRPLLSPLGLPSRFSGCFMPYRMMHRPSPALHRWWPSTRRISSGPTCRPPGLIRSIFAASRLSFFAIRRGCPRRIATLRIPQDMAFTHVEYVAVLLEPVNQRRRHVRIFKKEPHSENPKFDVIKVHLLWCRLCIGVKNRPICAASVLMSTSGRSRWTAAVWRLCL